MIKLDFQSGARMLQRDSVPIPWEQYKGWDEELMDLGCDAVEYGVLCRLSFSDGGGTLESPLIWLWDAFEELTSALELQYLISRGGAELIDLTVRHDRALAVFEDDEDSGSHFSVYCYSALGGLVFENGQKTERVQCEFQDAVGRLYWMAKDYLRHIRTFAPALERNPYHRETLDPLLRRISILASAAEVS